LDAAYISALFGLAGACIGGLTSFSTAWLTQSVQIRDRRREADTAKREQLFSDFITEASRLYADALSHEKDDVTDLVPLYAMVARMRLLTSQAVVDAAEQAMTSIAETYLQPNRTLHELRALAQQGGMNFLQDFGEACRVEMAGAATIPRYSAPRPVSVDHADSERDFF
jgi:hypothetical protein